MPAAYKNDLGVPCTCSGDISHFLFGGQVV